MPRARTQQHPADSLTSYHITAALAALVLVARLDCCCCSVVNPNAAAARQLLLLLVHAMLDLLLPAGVASALQKGHLST